MLANIAILACGAAALVYGANATRQVLAADAGNARMQEISAAVQEGARAYLNRQYFTIGVVGLVILVILAVLLSIPVAVGFAIGALLSAAAGYIGMNVSVRANVRTAQAARASPLALMWPSRRVPSPACWWWASACWASPATIPTCAAR